VPHISPTATSILTLLNNINDLIVESNDRENARDVMKATKIYAASKNFPLPEEKVEDFYAVLIDSRPFTLSALIHDIATDIIVADQKK